MSDQAEIPGLGKGRIETLADGVFAIAMTLLVLNFKVPAFDGTPSNEEVWQKLQPMWVALGTYVIAFVNLGIYWISHHNIFDHIRRSDHVILWLNIYFLMAVAFFPFATSMYSSNPFNQLVAILFGANLLLIGLLLFSIWVYATLQPGFVPLTLESHFRHQMQRRVLIAPGAALIGVLAALWNPLISAVVFLTMIPLFIIAPSGVDRLYAQVRKEAAKLEEEELLLRLQSARWSEL